MLLSGSCEKDKRSVANLVAGHVASACRRFLSVVDLHGWGGL